MNKRKVFILFLCILVLIPLVSFAQSTARGSRARGSAQQFTLTIRSNVNNAQIYIDNERQSGSLPFSAQLNAGDYTITLKKNGYYDASARVSLSKDQTVTINLQATTYNLTVKSNAKDARLFIDGDEQGGSIPFTVSLAPGTYDLTLESPKWQDETRTIELEKDMTINFNLKRAQATVMAMKPDPDMQVFVDGKPEKKNPFKVQPGEHEITFSLGGLSVTETINFEAGESYQILPELTLSIE